LREKEPKAGVGVGCYNQELDWMREKEPKVGEGVGCYNQELDWMKEKHLYSSD
jgi:hypothetical protein